MGGPVNLRIEHGLATITLARPQAGNAMDWALIDAFSAACEAVAADGSARAVLIEAEGRNFCVGGDVRVMAAEADPEAYLRGLASRLHEGIAVLAGLPAPVIVAVQGAAAGAGLSLAAGGDIVVAGESSSFVMAYTAIGLVADGGATWLLPRLVGLRLTQEMAYTGRRLSAAEAERHGLVTRVVGDDAVQAEARALAARIAAGPTFAFGRVKRLLLDSPSADLPTQLDAERQAIGDAMATADAQQAIRAFLDRRAPEFTGR